MPAQIHGAESPHKNIGWRVVFAGVGINLALGILYTWSVIAAGLPEKWTQSDKSWPYAVACLVFTAWGVGGFMLAKLAGWVYDATNSFNFAYYCSAALLVVAAAMTFALKPPHHLPAEQAA